MNITPINLVNLKNITKIAFKAKETKPALQPNKTDSIEISPKTKIKTRADEYYTKGEMIKIKAHATAEQIKESIDNADKKDITEKPCGNNCTLILGKKSGTSVTINNDTGEIQEYSKELFSNKKEYANFQNGKLSYFEKTSEDSENPDHAITECYTYDYDSEYAKLIRYRISNQSIYQNSKDPSVSEIFEYDNGKVTKYSKNVHYPKHNKNTHEEIVFN